MDYWIFYSRDSEDLTAQVLLAMKEGWEPLGGVAVRAPTRYTETYFYQAMTRVIPLPVEFD
jgi:hypothetical protein